MLIRRRRQVNQQGLAVRQPVAPDGNVEEFYHTSAAVCKHKLFFRGQNSQRNPDGARSGSEFEDGGLQEWTEFWGEQAKRR